MALYQSLADSSHYSAFVKARDRALDSLLQKARLEISDILRGTFRRVLEIVSHQYPQIPETLYFTKSATHVMASMDHSLSQLFEQSASEITARVEKLRRQSYLLAHAGETEAIARATGKPMRAMLYSSKLTDQSKKKTDRNEVLRSRILLGLNRIKRDILDAIETSRVMESPITDALERVEKSFPESRQVKLARRTLMESESDDAEEEARSQSIRFVDSFEWQELVDEYRKDFIPKHREPTKPFDKPLTGDEYNGLYAWEVEQEITHDFVTQVRDGQNDAATENGITDFVWIAVVDDKTDACCLWRDGLTTSEIQEQLDQHSDEDSDCDADNVVVPPAHFGCRCRAAPFTDQMPDVPPSVSGDFESWLNNS